jgi:hypothetical protein
LEWPASLTIDAYGFRVALCASHRSALDALHRIVPPGARPCDAPDTDARYSVILADGARPSHRLYEDEKCVARSTEARTIFESLQSRMHFAVAVGARTRLFVHAGVVGWNGGAILMPGHSHAGKSSLVSALVRSGATYYSDEYAVLDDQGLVYPFARPLGIREAHGRLRHVSPASLGAIVGDAPLPVRMVLLTQYAPGASWSPLPMSSGEMVLRLFEHTVAARNRAAAALRILCTAAVNAVGLRTSRGEADSVVDQILSIS